MSSTPTTHAAGSPAPAVENAAVPAAARWPWWVSGVVALIVGLAAVLVWIVAVNSGAERFGTVPPRKVNGATFQLMRGGGQASGTSFIVESAQDGVVLLSTEIPALAAATYPRVEWDLSSIDPPRELAFAWRTRENPARTYAKPLFWLGDRIVPLRLDANDGWRGTIIGVALVARGNVAAPLEVRSVNLPSGSAAATLTENFTQWGRRFPLKGYALAFPFDAERAHFLPIAKAMAIACALAIGVYLGLAYLRNRQVDWRVPLAIFAVAWILLDVRWQIDLGREVVAAAERFGGKSGDQKALAAEDAPFIALVQEVKRALPPPPARVYVLCDNPAVALRAAHFLFPHNVSRNRTALDEQRALTRTNAPNRTALRSGDYLMLVFYSGLRYDSDKGQLIWPDGGSLAADLVVAKPEALLVRIK